MTEFSAGTPDWARLLVARCCADAGWAQPTRVRWMRRDRPSSSGVTRRHDGSISMVAGSDDLDQRLTLLHELAHWLAPTSARRRRRRSQHHDRGFYAVAFALYERHGISSAEALAREAGRYPSSLRHARDLGVIGAQAAWRERHRSLRTRTYSPLRVLVPEHRIRLARDGRWTICEVCHQRIVGPNLARLRRRGGRHTLLTRELAS